MIYSNACNKKKKNIFIKIGSTEIVAQPQADCFYHLEILKRFIISTKKKPDW